MNIFDDIFKNNLWGSGESRSGTGSELNATVTIRREIPILLRNLNAKTMLDIPCGDVNWMKMIDLTDIEYIGADISSSVIEYCRSVMKNTDFRILDVTIDILPTVDVIFCRDCLVHLPEKCILSVIGNVKRSKSKYFISTTFPHIKKNSYLSIANGEWSPVNLEYFLGEPLVLIDEHSGWEDKSLGVWKI
jgi:SAM-dependent methyltransferase